MEEQIFRSSSANYVQHIDTSLLDDLSVVYIIVIYTPVATYRHHIRLIRQELMILFVNLLLKEYNNYGQFNITFLLNKSLV